jgi:hypothetical protein
MEGDFIDVHVTGKRLVLFDPASAANTERPRGSLKHVVSSHLPAAVIRGPPTHRRATKLLDDKFLAAVPSIRLPLTVTSMGTTGTSKNGSLTTLA